LEEGIRNPTWHVDGHFSSKLFSSHFWGGNGWELKILGKKQIHYLSLSLPNLDKQTLGDGRSFNQISSLPSLPKTKQALSVAWLWSQNYRAIRRYIQHKAIIKNHNASC